MRIGHIDFGICGLHRIAKPCYLWSVTPENTQRILQILSFWDKHGLAVTLEASEVSRRTLHHRKKTLHDAGGDPAALSSKSRAFKRPCKPVRGPWLVPEIRRYLSSGNITSSAKGGGRIQPC